MNLLKALEGISQPEKPSEEKNASVNASTAAAKTEELKATAGTSDGPHSEENFNAMQSVLERHEIIANRIKNKRRTER